MLHYQKDASRPNGNRVKRSTGKTHLKAKVDNFVYMYHTEVKNKKNTKVVTEQKSTAETTL